MKHSRMYTGAAFAALFGIALVPGAFAADPAKKDTALVVTDKVTAQATIVGIDKKKRRLTLRDQKGAEMEMVAGDEVRNFDQIKKNDVVTVEYRRAAATTLQKAEKADAAVSAQTVERAPAGSKPGMVATNTQSIVATVLEVDKKERTVTLQGPRGGIVTVKVPADMKNFDALKKGDKVSALYTEALAISVTPAAKKK